MKVMFLVSHLKSGGAERTVAYLSGHFAGSGVDTTVLSISDEVFYGLDDKVKLKTLGVSGGYKNAIDKIVKSVRRSVRVGKYLRRTRPDVIFCMLPTNARYVLKAKKRLKFKLIVSERNNPLMQTADKKKKEKIFAFSDGIVFQTERARACFPGNIAEKGVVIPNAVGNPDCYTVKAEPFKEKKFSAIGRLNEQKDYPTMIRAFAEFSKRHEGYRLEIFGEGKIKRTLENTCEELGISEQVLFLGSDKNVIAKISDSAAFIMTSSFEGMPNALMEAMAIGLPCISTDCPFGPAELIEDGENGLLVPVGDHKAFAAAMERIAEDGEFAMKIGVNAKKILESNNVNSISEQYLRYVTSVFRKSDD